MWGGLIELTICEACQLVRHKGHFEEYNLLTTAATTITLILGIHISMVLRVPVVPVA